MSKTLPPAADLVARSILRDLSRVTYRSVSEIENQLEKVGVTTNRRSLQRILKHLSEDSAQKVDRRMKRKPYAYRHACLETNDATLTLSPVDALLLRLAEEALDSTLPVATTKPIRRLFDAARRTLNESYERTADRELRRRVASFPDASPLTAPLLAPGVLEAVAESLFRESKLVIVGRNAQKTEIELLTTPLGVVRHGVRLSLIYLPDEGKQPTHVPLHWVLRAYTVDELAVRPKDFRLIDVFAQLPVPQEPNRPVRITMEFANLDFANRLAETPLAAGQKIKRNHDGGFTLTALLNDSPRFYAWVALWRTTAGITNVSVRPLSSTQKT